MTCQTLESVACGGSHCLGRADPIVGHPIILMILEITRDQSHAIRAGEPCEALHDHSTSAYFDCSET